MKFRQITFGIFIAALVALTDNLIVSVNNETIDGVDIAAWSACLCCVVYAWDS